ncbi:hypothetical protein [Phenylobacterium sp.]|uniref:hypothetical protein n=1 Tax=Phenylobacterium sp. TaxID=1871053 RepID=UPI00121BC474|nr:hypothetical protein [Phenylobacterium sp.]THD57894.1 MAG: hypothetical protein E8A49_22135 [Phenylobacterium sp.]
MTLLIYVGDALWIVALAIMAAASREAWKRMDADTRVPMVLRRDGSPAFRAMRDVALAAPPAVAFAVSLFLVAGVRNLAMDADEALILFGVRATLAALFALAHLRWLKAAMAQLEAEGALKS